MLPETPSAIAVPAHRVRCREHLGERRVRQPAQAGFEIRTGLALELPAGPLKLRAAASVAKMWPQELWMTDLTLGVTMSFE